MQDKIIGDNIPEGNLSPKQTPTLHIPSELMKTRAEAHERYQARLQQVKADLGADYPIYERSEAVCRAINVLRRRVRGSKQTRRITKEFILHTGDVDLLSTLTPYLGYTFKEVDKVLAKLYDDELEVLKKLGERSDTLKEIVNLIVALKPVAGLLRSQAIGRLKRKVD